MMAGIFYGSMYGGSTTAILLNIPGESASVVTAIDGYQLAKKGRAGATLTIVAVGSFIGGTLAVIGVMMFSSLSRPGRDPVRAGGIFRAHRGRPGRDVADFRRHAGLRAAADDDRIDAGDHRPGSGDRRDALHVWNSRSRRRRLAGARRGRALRFCGTDAAGRRPGACREQAAVGQDARAAADAHRMEARGAVMAARHVPRLFVRPGARACGDAGLVRLLPAGKGDVEIRRAKSAAAPSKASPGRKPPTIPPPPPRWCRCSRSAFPLRRSRR